MLVCHLDSELVVCRLEQCSFNVDVDFCVLQAFVTEELFDEVGIVCSRALFSMQCYLANLAFGERITKAFFEHNLL